MITLYLVDDEWVRDPQAPRARRTPAPVRDTTAAAQLAASRARRLAIHCDTPDGVYTQAFDAVVSTEDQAILVHYTEDGSDPSDARNPDRHAFTGSKRFPVRGSGPHALLCHAKDGAGNEGFAAFGWRIDDGDRP